MKPGATDEPQGCAYCGGSGRSREHYFPQWMHALLGPLPPRMLRSTDTHFHDQVGRVDHGLSTKSLGRPLVKDVARRVCKTCNNGWMSRLTETTKPALQRVLFSEAGTIDTADQELVAKWLCMTIMTVEIGQRYSGVEPSERHRFKGNQRVPDDWRIWIARYAGDRWVAAYHRHGAVVEYPDESKRASLAGFVTALGNSCFFAMAGAEPTQELEAALEQVGFRSIHPAVKPISWQSSSTMSDDVLDQMAAFITKEGDRNAEAVAATVERRT